MFSRNFTSIQNILSLIICQTENVLVSVSLLLFVQTQLATCLCGEADYLCVCVSPIKHHEFSSLISGSACGCSVDLRPPGGAHHHLSCNQDETWGSCKTLKIFCNNDKNNTDHHRHQEEEEESLLSWLWWLISETFKDVWLELYNKVWEEGKSPIK